METGRKLVKSGERSTKRASNSEVKGPKSSKKVSYFSYKFDDTHLFNLCKAWLYDKSTGIWAETGTKSTKIGEQTTKKGSN